MFADIDECKTIHIQESCEFGCDNTIGSYHCADEKKQEFKQIDEDNEQEGEDDDGNLDEDDDQKDGDEENEEQKETTTQIITTTIINEDEDITEEAENITEDQISIETTTQREMFEEIECEAGFTEDVEGNCAGKLIFILLNNNTSVINIFTQVI